MAATDGRRCARKYASLGIAASPLAAISHILYLFSKTVISESLKGQKNGILWNRRRELLKHSIMFSTVFHWC